ncbi:3-hydroxyacyl-CoA dehydrogenase [Polymorphobacter multimanifer]|uniref:SDR family NAD(P)-dependent oxidoreductase n=1 Tax=Polymorphobacter multimanifer TaxID=1070431 RepID=UPI00166F1500|nr:SDR family NAD(P)-dependent oxidoreductase [Polymorphobacter multimanifer]GGI83652.1 3-hydroxyacyl-CoA dehydrogenase [Polymorphobacter multimanifer]
MPEAASPRHALITGGGTGIGAAIATALAAEGCRVTLLGRREGPLRAVAEGLPDAGFVTGDVTCPESIDTAFCAARAARGPIDILVANAGAAESWRFAAQGRAAWRRRMAVNLDAVHDCAQAALPDRLASPAGRLVVGASTAGLKGYGFSVAYSAAKHGAIGLVRSLAMELAGTKVTVNAVCPGVTDTDIVAEAVATISGKTGRSAQAARAELARFNPQGRLIDPLEVARAVAWLACTDSRSITGQSIIVAGGEIM